MKTRRVCAIILSLAMVLTMTACSSGDNGSSTNTTTANSEKNQTQNTVEESKPVELSFSMHDSAATLKYTYTKEWCDDLNEATDGKLNIAVYAGGAIAGVDTVLDALASGSCDIAMIYTAWWDTVFTKLNIVSLPMMGLNSAQDATNVLWDMYEQIPEVAAEFENFHLCQMYSNGCSYLHFADKPVNTYDGVSGLKLRIDSGSMSEFLSACNAIPMAINPSETYEAVEKGIVNGGVASGSLIKSWNLGEVLDYGMDMPLYAGVWLTLMNKDVYESLPDDLKQAVDDASGRETSLYNAGLLQGENDDSFEDMEANGYEWLQVSDDDVAKFEEASMGYKNQWIDDHTTSDFDAQAYYEQVLAIIAARE